MYFCNTRWPNHCGFFFFFLEAYLATLVGCNAWFGSLWPLLYLVNYYYPSISVSFPYSTSGLACFPPSSATNYWRFSNQRLLLSSAALFCFIFPRSTTKRPLCVYSICIHSRLSHILKPQNSSPVSRSFPYRMNPLGFQERVIRSRFSEDPRTLKGEVYTDGQTTYTLLSAAVAVAFPLQSNTRLT